MATDIIARGIAAGVVSQVSADRQAVSEDRAAVETAKTEVLNVAESIPEDYSKLSAAVGELKSDLADYEEQVNRLIRIENQASWGRYYSETFKKYIPRLEAKANRVATSFFKVKKGHVLEIKNNNSYGHSVGIWKTDDLNYEYIERNDNEWVLHDEKIYFDESRWVIVVFRNNDNTDYSVNDCHSEVIDKCVNAIRNNDIITQTTEITSNIFDKSNAFLRSCDVGADSQGNIVVNYSNGTTVCVVLNVKPNTNYVISKKNTDTRFRCFTTNVYPAYGTIVNNYNKNDNGTSIEVNTHDDNYLIIYLYNPTFPDGQRNLDVILGELVVSEIGEEIYNSHFSAVDLKARKTLDNHFLIERGTTTKGIKDDNASYLSKRARSKEYIEIDENGTYLIFDCNGDYEYYVNMYDNNKNWIGSTYAVSNFIQMYSMYFEKAKYIGIVIKKVDDSDISDEEMKMLEKKIYLTKDKSKAKKVIDTVIQYLHRGAYFNAPENTLSSMTYAKKLGYTHIEFDVQFTSDNVPIVIHDHTLDRTSNGSGKVSDFTLEQLKELDFGSWFNNLFAGETIPTLDEMVKHCKKLGLNMYVELKDVVNTKERVDLVYNIIRKNGMLSHTIFETYIDVPISYQEIKELIDNDIEKAQQILQLYTLTNSNIDNAKTLGFSIIGGSVAKVSQSVIDYAHSNGMILIGGSTVKNEIIDCVENRGVYGLFCDKHNIADVLSKSI